MRKSPGTFESRPSKSASRAPSAPEASMPVASERDARKRDPRKPDASRPAGDPQALLEAASAAEDDCDFTSRAALLDRLVGMVPPSGPAWWEIEAELIRDAARSPMGPRGGADIEARADAVLASDIASPQARIRTLQAIGVLASKRGTAAALDAAEQYFTEAIGQAAALGNDHWRAQSLASLAYRVHFPRGEFAAATAALQTALGFVIPGGRPQALLQAWTAEINGAQGNAAVAVTALNAAAATARQRDDPELNAQVARIEATLAAIRQDQPSTLLWLAEAERHFAAGSAPTSAEFYAEASLLCGCVGLHGDADTYLASARAAAGTSDPAGTLLLAIAAREARIGEPSGAEELLQRALHDPGVPARQSWRIHLFRGLAHHRRGDVGAAVEAIGSAYATAAGLGDTGLPERVEADTIAALAGLIPIQGDEAMFRINLFGRFEVLRQDRLLSVPTGKPAEVVKILALRRSGRIAVDDLIELLWPESRAGLGRQRLRNVLLRLRAQAGEVVQRRYDELALADETRIDVAEFVRDSTSVLGATLTDRQARIEHARAALANYVGDLLPGDMHQPWAEMPRDRLRVRALALLGIMADAAEQGGDDEEALRVIARMHRLSPLDERHAVRAAQLLTDRGQIGRARAWWMRAEQICAELGIPAPARG